jgi:AcrR family transcriptional regulator
MSAKGTSQRRKKPKLGRPIRSSDEKPTKERIFDAAVELFSEQGYDRTSVRQIAAAVGITEAAVYRHYSNKEAILDAILEYLDDHLYRPLPGVEMADTGGASIFRSMLAPLPGIVAVDPNMVKITRILFAEMNHNEGIRGFLRNELGEKADDHTEALFKRRIEDGSIRPCDPRSLARVFNAFREKWLLENFIIAREGDLDAEKIEEALNTSIEFFETLLCARKDK